MAGSYELMREMTIVSSHAFKFMKGTNRVSYCTLYTDGLGGYDWYPPPDGKNPHRFHTLAGIVIDPESDLRARDGVDGILSGHIPPETRSLRPAAEYELHFDAIKSARGIYRKVGKKERDEIIRETFDLILELGVVVVASTGQSGRTRQARGGVLSSAVLHHAARSIRVFHVPGQV